MMYFQIKNILKNNHYQNTKQVVIKSLAMFCMLNYSKIGKFPITAINFSFVILLARERK